MKLIPSGNNPLMQAATGYNMNNTDKIIHCQQIIFNLWHWTDEP